MALRDEVDKITRELHLRVRIGGTQIRPVDPTSETGVPGILGLQVAKSFDSPVPVVSVTVNRIPAWINRGQKVEIELGYNGHWQRVFTGTVQDRSHGVRRSDINCAGTLHKLFRGIEIPSRIVGANTKVAIEAILDDIGILSTDRDTADIPTTTLGAFSSPTLERQLVSQMVKTLMDVDGVRVFEDGNGIATFKVMNGVPSGASFRKYTSDDPDNARILGAGVREDPSFTRTRVTVLGATIEEGTLPDTTSRTIERTASLVGPSPILPPLESGQHIDAEYSNHLIDSDALADTVAIRLLTEFARVPRSLTLQTPGDPELELGMTLFLVYPEQQATGMWFVQGIKHIVDAQGYRTILDLRGGPEFGNELGINPQASFSESIDRQVIDDDVYATVTFDASASRDPDSNVALTYAWSDNQSPEITTPDIETLTDRIITVKVLPADITGDWKVTLTVTDTDGLTGSKERTIEVVATAADVKIPAIFAALDNRFSATPNGGENWNDQVEVTVISVAARPDDGVNFGHAVFGTANGEIWRTLDYCVTALQQEVVIGGAPRIEALAWDWRDANRVWALTDNFLLYLSTDGGDSWTLYDDLRSVLSESLAIGKHIGLPGSGGVWVYGGDGAGNALIAYDASVHGHNWVRLPFGGELDADMPHTSASLAIVDANDKGDGSGLAIILENANGTVAKPAIYHCVSPFQPSTWKRATGLDDPLTTGRYVVGANGISTDFIAAFNNRDVWKSLGGIAWAKTADVMPVGVTPNHAIWVRASEAGELGTDFYLIAATD